MKTNKIALALTGIILIVMLVPTVFANGPPPPPPELVTELVVGRKEMPVGNVTVWECDGYLHVKYETTGCWHLVETHLAVATSFEEIPQTKKGNPIPGHFPYSSYHKPMVTEYTYEVDLDGDTVYIAAHAVVYCDCGCYFETAWGEGPTSADFPGRNWAMYFTYPE